MSLCLHVSTAAPATHLPKVLQLGGPLAVQAVAGEVERCHPRPGVVVAVGPLVEGPATGCGWFGPPSGATLNDPPPGGRSSSEKIEIGTKIITTAKPSIKWPIMQNKTGPIFPLSAPFLHTRKPKIRHCPATLWAAGNNQNSPMGGGGWSRAGKKGYWLEKGHWPAGPPRHAKITTCHPGGGGESCLSWVPRGRLTINGQPDQYGRLCGFISTARGKDEQKKIIKKIGRGCVVEQSSSRHDGNIQ